jgi:hypothetical protein
MARVSAEILDAMVASGCSAEQIAAVVKAALGSAKSGAERQAAYRARKNADHDDVTVTEVTESDESDVTLRNVTNERNEPSLSPVPLLPPTPPNNPLTPKPTPKNTARGSRLPADWTLSGPNLAYALAKGFPEDRIGVMAEKFANWAWSASGPNAVKRNWDRAWQNWVLSELERGGSSRSPPVRPLTPREQSRQTMKEITDGLASFAAGGSRSSQADLGFLPGHSGEQPEGVRGRTGGSVVELSASRRGESG